MTWSELGITMLFFGSWLLAIILVALLPRVVQRHVLAASGIYALASTGLLFSIEAMGGPYLHIHQHEPGSADAVVVILSDQFLFRLQIVSMGGALWWMLKLKSIRQLYRHAVAISVPTTYELYIQLANEGWVLNRRALTCILIVMACSSGMTWWFARQVRAPASSGRPLEG